MTTFADQFINPRIRYFLDTDNDSHWYIVPEANRSEWYAWKDIPEGDERGWEPPEFAKPVGGCPSLVTFTNPTNP